MKHALFSLVFSLAVVSPLVVACSAETEPAPGTPGEPGADQDGTPVEDDAAELKAGKKKTCASAGGACVGLSPSSCMGGTWADATKVSCGYGLGVACCIPSCPVLVPPSPGFCRGGKVVTKKDAAGCTHYTCVPAATTCASAGGTCVGIAPSSCPGGKWANAAIYSCGPGIGAGCCLP